MNLAQASEALVAAGRTIDGRGWVPATSGNFSVRLDDGDLAITASGRHKGQLTVDDIMRVDLAGESPEGRRPSAETGLHTQLYRRDPKIGTVLHTHSLGATVASMHHRSPLRFEGLEILKAFTGITTHEVAVDIPIFANDQRIDRLAEAVDRHMDEAGIGVAYLIAGHGLYTWAPDLPTCLRHLEALEYLFDYLRCSPTEAT
ncbi:MAG: methylthioribulose 1-phosphate dehydratase [Pseudomonadota bacterium]